MENLHIPNSTYLFFWPILKYLPYFAGSLFHILLELWGYSVTDDSGKLYTLSPAVCKEVTPLRSMSPALEWMVTKTKK